MSHLGRGSLLLPLMLSLLAAVAHADPTALADRAVAANPALQALRYQTTALSARAEVAGAWTDPVVGVEYSNVPVLDPTLGAHPMGGLQLRVQQQLHAAGWSAAQRAVAEGHVQTLHADHAEATLQLRTAVQRAWWLLARSRALEAVTRTHLARAEELVEAATARYQTGAAGQHGVLRLTVLRDQLADDLGDFDRADAELRAALRAALGGADPGALQTPEEPEPLPAPPPADWAAIAAANRPAIAAHRAAAETAGLTSELARQEARPDLQVWAGYRLRSPQAAGGDPGSDLVSMGVAVPVPTGSRRRAGGAQAAADAERLAEEARAASMEAKAAARAEAAHARWRRAAAKTATLNRTLLPGARAALDTARGDFAVGRADFASLFEAETALLALERVRIQTIIDTRLARVEMQAALGTDAPGGPP